MSKKERQAARGYSLIELAIVLMVIGGVLSALWIATGRAWNYAMREKMKEEIATTVTNMRSYVGGMPGVPNLGWVNLTDQLITANVIPKELVRPGQCLGKNCADNAWGSTSGGAVDANGTFRVCGWALGVGMTQCSAAALGTPPFFGIQITGLTQNNCIALVEAISSPMGPKGLVDVYVNTADLGVTYGQVYSQTDAAATTNCLLAANGAAYVTFAYSTTAPSN